MLMFSNTFERLERNEEIHITYKPTKNVNNCWLLQTFYSVLKYKQKNIYIYNLIHKREREA